MSENGRNVHCTSLTGICMYGQTLEHHQSGSRLIGVIRDRKAMFPEVVRVRVRIATRI
jgi:hypothetical protein